VRKQHAINADHLTSQLRCTSESPSSHGCRPCLIELSAKGGRCRHRGRKSGSQFGQLALATPAA